MYCTDTDLLRWEPALFVEAALASQALFESEGDLSGARLTTHEAVDLRRIHPGHVVTFEGSGMHQSLPIVSIDSPNILLLDVTKRSTHFAASRPLKLWIRSFAAQRQIAGDLLSRLVGVGEGSATHPLTSQLLRRPATLGALQMIYNALSAASAGDDADLIVRTELYGRLYRSAVRDLIAEIGSNPNTTSDEGHSLCLTTFTQTVSEWD